MTSKRPDLGRSPQKPYFMESFLAGTGRVTGPTGYKTVTIGGDLFRTPPTRCSECTIFKTYLVAAQAQARQSAGVLNDLEGLWACGVLFISLK
jgi:hypothetical protein